MRNVSTQPLQSPAADESEAAHIREALDGQFVCPFCGVVNSTGEGLCPRCSMENTPAARKATKARIGPWYVYQHRNPAAPGMKFETLLAFVRKGKVKPRSIVRGPTTGQLWRFAAHVKGLSREFGVCYSCGAAIETIANICPQCNHLQEPPINSDVLLESSADQQRTAAAPSAKSVAAPPQSARSAALKSGPFSSDIADTDLPQIDDLLIENDPPQSAIGTAPVAAFRKPAQQDSFLSARELATAFNLGFTPPSGSRAGRRPRRRGGWGKRIAIFLLLVAVGASGGVMLQPQLRQRVIDWTSQKWKSLQPVATAKAPKKADSATSDSDDLPKSMREAHALPNRSSSPTTKPSEHTTTAPPLVNAQKPANTQKPPVINNPPPQTQSAVVQKQMEAQPPSTDGQSSSTSNQKPPVPPPSDNAGTADAADQARALYNQGIDAEQHVDFAAAVKCYEKIMKLPRDVWPTDLELRLRLARKQAEQK